MPELRIALAQVNVTLGDFNANTAHILSIARDAATQDARLIVFGEMALPGMPAEGLAANPGFVAASLDAMDSLAEQLATAGLGEMTVIVGGLGSVPGESGDHAPTNRAFVLRSGRVLAHYDKQVLKLSGPVPEHPALRPGDSPLVIEVDGIRVAITFETDLGAAHRRPEAFGPSPDLLVILTGSPFRHGIVTQRTEKISVVSRRLGIAAAYVNLVGGQDETVFDGGSFLTGDRGQVLERAPQFREGLLVTTLGRTGAEHSEVDSHTEPDPDAELYGALVLGLRDYLTKNGFRSVILGMSGGIDSALLAAIAADAIGGENVVGVSMPSAFSSQHSIDDAVDQAKRLGADLRTQPIEEAVDLLRRQLGLDGIAAENLQARVRGVILMGLSNAEGHLVLAPGNKSELAVGYSTIYGDAVGGFGPLKDVWKSRVWALARARNIRALDAGRIPPIPESCITKPPSAELRPDQVDQDSLPPYDVLDAVLTAYIEERAGVPEILLRGFDAEVVDKVSSLVGRAEWKRRQYPIGTVVSPVSLGRDRRAPITNRWRERPGSSPTPSPSEGTNDDSP